MMNRLPGLTVKLVVAVLAISCLIITYSCSGEKSRVIRGTVFLDGVSLTHGVVQFHSESGQLVTAVVQRDGKFTATDLPMGEFKVAVVEDIMAIPRRRTPGWIAIPRKYSDSQKSGINFSISNSTDDLEINLASK